MARTDLTIKTLDSNLKTQSTKISYINPEATGTQLLAFANAFADLSDNTLGDATVTRTESVLDYDPTDPRLDNTITLINVTDETTPLQPTFTMAQLQTGIVAKITSTSNGKPYIDNVTYGIMAGIREVNYQSGKAPQLMINNDSGAQPGKICTITVDGDDTYKPATLDITLTA